MLTIKKNLNNNSKKKKSVQKCFKFMPAQVKMIDQSTEKVGKIIIFV